MRRAEIDGQNRGLLQRQRTFRRAADAVTEAWTTFPEVVAIGVIGSVAGPLWKEVPRFREFRRAGIEVWHECGDLDLALWIDSQQRLGELRRASVVALNGMSRPGLSGVASHELDVFLFDPASDPDLGRLCSYSQCPRGKLDCLVPAAAKFLSRSASRVHAAGRSPRSCRSRDALSAWRRSAPLGARPAERRMTEG